MDLKNSTVLITGGTSGIGLELVKQLTDQGATLIITGRNPDALLRTKAQFPNIQTFQSDVSNPQDIEQLYNEVTKQFPALNIIVNNAGAMRLIDLQDRSMDLENITREIDTNLSGTIQMVHQFLPHLLKQTSAAIVNVSSGIAFMSYSSAPVYSATKAGVRAYTQALRLQLEDTNVKVFEMIPPGVNTNLQNDWAVQPNPAMMMDVDKMVHVVVNALKNDTLEIKPFLINVIKAMSRIAPGLMIKFGHREFAKLKTQTN
ncbi:MULTISPECIES: SDR family NAD(P)-dependent oxidoreductase [unclassified Spirosoma]|uniref:SDR family oxidoreductase n=1 Tax=unclassified Spirosoma TaxID=2621999 RepID=UPI0009681947|nr:MULTISPECIES: SDR family NAD(P)-dependent oxidoreductase [unclassified Spirosoma]MBN8822645.1 SDR family NAD(P)-dependent oxidoreductase [Spirosoma sp.]OJW74134.1 MAG: short-chain dehydrogenase [Spirosoma sp. 48-14]